MTLALGTKLGRYEIRSPIGAGGMGEVYRARDEKLNRDVAIKVLPATLSQNADRLRRFEQEAQAAGALNHPNILAVYDVGMHDGAPYVVSELLEGESLKERLGDGPLAQRKAVDYAVQIAHGLAAAHGKGIIHRDLKPDNLFIREVETLFRAHHERVFRTAHRITGSAADAEDVLQTVFLRLVKGQESYDLSGHPEAYLSRAAINASLDWRHSDGHRRRSHNHHPPNKCGITLSGPRRQRTPSIRIGSRYPKNHLSFRLWTLKVR